ncbi:MULTISPECIES: DUF432 domain-containing protein [unclassified Arsukibacterium]|uniref:DUF432 domain-containing protein n=1 Tax=unclassified Arsukibacterium TaxID=2635278 RepID=UPI000C699F30|nr:MULTISPECIES: DUF432 domain-containing protein [unclassified Arsukibacterium]MBM34148.1 hypothetical protein [Rheinheimera sp.]HAW92473.1 hypothetical protein [Candidatus Azambacteria bacterium]
MQPQHHNDTPTGNPWWQPIALNSGQSWHYVFGPLTLYLQRLPVEWLLGFTRVAEQDVHSQMQSSSIRQLPDLDNLQRFVFRQSPAQFCLSPKLLDRPMVVKTRTQLSIPPAQQAVFYISSPVVIEVNLQQPACSLIDIASQRLSDTWFGPSTLHGELCYADKTQARHDRADLPVRPHRAVTAVTIENNANSMLVIDKLSIPLPYLALYGLNDGSLWTDPITLQHDGNHALTRFKISKQLPAGVTAAARIAGPRQNIEKQGLIRAFTGMFND